MGLVSGGQADPEESCLNLGFSTRDSGNRPAWVFRESGVNDDGQWSVVSGNLYEQPRSAKWISTPLSRDGEGML